MERGAESLAQTLVKPLMKQMQETEVPQKERDVAQVTQLLASEQGLDPKAIDNRPRKGSSLCFWKAGPPDSCYRQRDRSTEEEWLTRGPTAGWHKGWGQAPGVLARRTAFLVSQHRPPCFQHCLPAADTLPCQASQGGNELSPLGPRLREVEECVAGTARTQSSNKNPVVVVVFPLPVSALCSPAVAVPLGPAPNYTHDYLAPITSKLKILSN